MAVYDRSYEPYDGPLTARRRRFLIVPKYAYQDIFASKAFLSFFVACFIVPLIWAVLIYATHNLTFLERWAALTGEQVGPGGLDLFQSEKLLVGYVNPQFWMAFFLVFIVGPALIAADMQNNGLPLYLSRPFKRSDYILGKLSVLMILLSLVTWVPGLALFALKGYLAGKEWTLSNLHIAWAMVVGFGASIVLLSLVSLALSAYMRWKPLARLGLIGVFIVLLLMGQMINGMLRTEWGTLINLPKVVVLIWADLVDVQTGSAIPAWAAWASLITACGFFLAVLARKVRAYEVVR